MQNGVYSLTFSSQAGARSAGVIVYDGGRAHGGDAGYYYKGRIEVEGGWAHATIEIALHRQREVSIFRPLINFTLLLDGTATEDSFALRGGIVNMLGPTITITGRRVSDL